MTFSLAGAPRTATLPARLALSLALAAGLGFAPGFVPGWGAEAAAAQTGVAPPKGVPSQSASTRASYGRAPLGSVSTQRANETPDALKNVGFDQLLGAELPLDLTLFDEDGEEVALGSYFADKPVVLVPVYYDCPMLCTLVMNSVASSLDTLDMVPGEDFEVVAFSFDATDTPDLAREKKRLTLLRYDRPEQGEAGWHFLSPLPPAEDAPEGGEAAEPSAAESAAAEARVRRLTDAIGFRFSPDPATGELAHTAGFVVATPDGRVARYFYGLEYPGRDVRLALVEASEGQLGSLADQVFLYCFRYDPTTGQYSAVSLNLVRVAGVLAIVLLGGFIALALWRERTHKQNSLGTA